VVRNPFSCRADKVWLLGIAFLLNWSAGRFVFYASMPARSRKG
jgi:hypothetical protein